MSTEWIKLIWKVYLAKVKFPARRNLTSITHGQSFILFPLSPQAIFSPLIASADSCSFLFPPVSSSSSSCIISLFSNYCITCNFMWFIKLRTSAGMCGVCTGVCGCALVCAGVCGCVRVCSGVLRCAWVCTGVHGRAQVCVSGHKCARVYAGVCGSAWVSASVCVWDGFSEYLLENRVPTSYTNFLL